MSSTDPGDARKSSATHPSPPGLVIFDCDGILVDSERISVAVEARVLTQLGVPHAEEEVVRRFAGRIYSATEVPRGKPAPDLFLHAARSMGAEPGRCAVVEDSAYGVRAAVAAGMTAYGFTGGLVDAEALAEAGAILFDRMADLGDVLLPPSG